ncbi:hypothetical protein Tco_0009555 [Tanacetum coccineum]
MVAYLEKSTGSAGFHQIIDFINQSHICYALTKKPEVCVSFIKQFWRTAEIATNEDGNVKIHATIDGHSLSITEGSIRRHLKLDDKDGLISLPSSEIFAQLALMGYATNSDKLTFQKDDDESSPSPSIPTSSSTPEPSPTQPSPPLTLTFTTNIHQPKVKKQESSYKGWDEARRHSRFWFLSDTEVGGDDSSKQGRKFSNEGFQDDEGVHEKASTETELFIQEVTPTEIIHEQEGSGKVSDEISTAGKKKDTASEEVPPVSTAEVHISTAGGTATYSRIISREKKKIRVIVYMTERRDQEEIQEGELEQERLSYAEALRFEEPDE